MFKEYLKYISFNMFLITQENFSRKSQILVSKSLGDGNSLKQQNKVHMSNTTVRVMLKVKDCLKSKDNQMIAHYCRLLPSKSLDSKNF